MCAPRLLGAFSTISRISKWAVWTAPKAGQKGAQRAKQSGRGRPCYMYTRSLPIWPTNLAAINSQQRRNALMGPDARISNLMHVKLIENLCVNIFLSNALWLIYMYTRDREGHRELSENLFTNEQLVGISSQKSGSHIYSEKNIYSKKYIV